MGLKAIKSKNPEIKRETSLNRYLGVDLRIKEVSEDRNIDIYQLWHDLRHHVSTFMSSLPLPMADCKRSTVSITYHPETSDIKEVDFFIGADTAFKESLVSEITGTWNIEEKIEKICSKFSPKDVSSCESSLKEKLQQYDPEIRRECEESKVYKQQQQQKHQQQLSLQSQFNEKKCMEEKQLIKEEYKLCMQKLSEEGKSSTESRRYCSRVHSMSKLSQRSQECLHETVEKLIQGSAASISGGVILRGRDESRDSKIETHLTVGEKIEKGKKGESQVSIKMSVESSRLRKPVDVEIHAVGQIQRPNQKWSVEGLLKEELTSRVLVHGDLGFRGEEKESIKTNILAIRSDEQVRFVKESEEYERCVKDEEPKGRKLAHSCKETRHRLASLDRIHAELSLPRTVADNRITELATEAVKMYYLPYLSQRNIEKSSRGEQEQYEIEAKVDGRGRTLSVKVSGKGEEVKVENLRLGPAAKDLLPICTKTNFATRVLQKLTGSNSPSSCVIDAGKVKTFDKYEYDYSLNDCEHIIFTEASPRPRVTVSAKETPQKQTVIMFVDGHKYEIEIRKESRHSRDN